MPGWPVCVWPVWAVTVVSRSPAQWSWLLGTEKGGELLHSLPTPSQHSRTPLRAGSGQPSLFPSSLGVMNARAAYRVTITQLGCQRQPRPSLETPPQLKGGASGPSKRLYSALTDVSQTSVTPSGGTQSTPKRPHVGPGNLFMSPLSSGSQKCPSCLGRPTPPVLRPGQRRVLNTEAAWWAFTSRSAIC